MSQLELAGIPTVVLGTTAFTKAAEEQWAALGYGDGPYVAVAHPLGSMPVERALAEADNALEAVIALLLRNGQPEAAQPRSRSRKNGRRPLTQPVIATARPAAPDCGHPHAEEDT